MKHYLSYKKSIISLSIFIIAAIFSEGFMHPDEHYSVLELLNLKIGGHHDETIFNWDFKERIRSWFQIFIYYLIYLIVPLDNPFHLSFIFRLFNGFLGFFSIFLLLKLHYKKESLELPLLIFSSFWFVPFLLVRTSPESFAFSFFLIGFYFFHKSSRLRHISSLFWGISFLSKFQMGAAILPIMLYDLLKYRKYSDFLLNTVIIIVVTIFGIVIDYWGYNEWHITWLNYLKLNIFENKASSFGTSPFYFYLTKPILKSGLIPGLVLIFSFFIHYYKKSKDSLYYSIIFFILIHMIIPHKEVRFLTTVYLLFPLYFIINKDKSNILRNNIVKFFLILINGLFLVKVLFTPAEGYISLYKFLYKSPIKTINTIEKNNQSFSLTMPFYTRSDLHLEKVRNNELPPKSYLLTTKFEEYSHYENLCENIYSKYHRSILDYNFFKWRDRSAIPAVWKCN